MFASVLRIAVLVPILGLTQHVVAETSFGPQSDAQAAPSCIDVQVGDARSVSYDCLSQQLTPPERKPRHPDIPNPALDSERATRLPPNQTGLKTSLQRSSP